MKISPNFSSFNLSSKGMSIQKRKMDLIAENMANTDTTKTNEGTPYQRKYLTVKNEETFNNSFNAAENNSVLKMSRNNSSHIQPAKFESLSKNKANGKDDTGIESDIAIDRSQGNLVHMPDHPDADEKGYIELPNVNVVNEMVEMISATRSYEANLTAFNSSKQIAKDSLDI